jgi:hypothetical protein
MSVLKVIARVWPLHPARRFVDRPQLLGLGWSLLNGDPMQGKEKERWFELCERASTEQDPIKLSELVEEVDRLLQEKQERLKARNPLAD